VNNASKNTQAEQVISSKEQYEKLLSQNELLLSENEYLKQQLQELKRLIFGSKSERFISDDSQLSLFDTDKEKAPETETEEINYTREKAVKEKQVAVRAKIPSHLPRVEEVVEPENIEDGSKKIVEEIIEVLEYNPAKVYVRKIVRPKYAKAHNDGVVIAELPTLPIPKGNAGASMLAYILVSKFVDHLPYYRKYKYLKDRI